MNPSVATCIFSTLNFVSEHVQKPDCTPILIFDQPLYWKAYLIINEEPLNSNLKKMVLRLCGFHTEMSLLGAT